jgi:hypothetical protein
MPFDREVPAVVRCRRRSPRHSSRHRADLLLASTETDDDEGGTMRAKITAEQLARTALVYVRQSTPARSAIIWRASDASMRSPMSPATWASAASRPSTMIWASRAVDSPTGRFQRLLTTVCAGTAGAVLALEASRLARNDRDWSQLVELGAITKLVLIDHDGSVTSSRQRSVALGPQGSRATSKWRRSGSARSKRSGPRRNAGSCGCICQSDSLCTHGSIELDPDVRVQQAI